MYTLVFLAGLLGTGEPGDPRSWEKEVPLPTPPLSQRPVGPGLTGQLPVAGGGEEARTAQAPGQGRYLRV